MDSIQPPDEPSTLEALNHSGVTDQFNMINWQVDPSLENALVGDLEAVIVERMRRFRGNTLELLKVVKNTFPDDDDLHATLKICENMVTTATPTTLLKIAEDWRVAFKPYMLTVMRHQLTLDDVKLLCASNSMFATIGLDKLWNTIMTLSASMEKVTRRPGASHAERRKATPIQQIYTLVHMGNRLAYVLHSMNAPGVRNTARLLQQILIDGSRRASNNQTPRIDDFMGPLLEIFSGSDGQAPSNVYLATHAQIMHERDLNGRTADLDETMSQIDAIIPMMLGTERYDRLRASVMTSEEIKANKFPAEWCFDLSDDDDDEGGGRLGKGNEYNVLSGESMDDMRFD